MIAQASEYLAESGVDPQDGSRLAYESWVATEALIAAGIGPQTSRGIVERSLERLSAPDTAQILDTVDAARASGQIEPRIRDLPFMIERCRAISGAEATYCDAPASKTPVTLPSRTSDVITTLNTRDRAPNAETIFANVPIILPEQTQKTAVIPVAESPELRASVEAGLPTGLPEGAIVRAASTQNYIVDTSDAPLSVFDDVANDPNDPDKMCKGESYSYWNNPAFMADLRAALDRAVAAKIARNVRLNQTQLLVLDSGFVDLGPELIAAAGLGALYLRDDPMIDASLPGMDAATRQKIDHGTAVTSVAMGGPGLMGGLGDAGAYIRVRTKAAFLSRTENSRTVFRVRENLPGLVSGYEPEIVNLSIGALEKSLGNLEGFQLAFNPDGPLFVVSAGNNGNNDPGAPGTSVALAQIVPQIWATAAAAAPSTGAFNVIVVAALDGTQPMGDLAWFSNFGEDHVYLAAPGCNIPALHANANGSAYIEQFHNGTSFAAPIVSFVAALTHSVLPDLRRSSPWVRARLLSTADITPRLERKVNWGRILNPVAALRVYEDVITLKDPLQSGGPLELAGKIVKIGANPDPVMGDVCVGNFASGHTLLRLFHDGQEPTPEWSVDLIDINRFMTTQPCTLKDGAVTLTMNGVEEPIPVPISNIADLKFAINSGE